MATHRIKNHPVNDHLLRYKNSRWARLSGVLVAVCIAIYLSQSASTPPNGGTWQGYVLGTIGALLIVWLTALGIRKRSYNANGTVQGWTSAHVYLGTACLVIGTLHCAFQFGFNVHTLAWVLMAVVVVSGFYGLYAYLRLPSVLAVQRGNLSRSELIGQLTELDQQSLALAQKLGAEVYSFVDSAIERSTIGGNRFQQLLGRDTSRLLMRGGEGAGTQSTLVSNSDQNVAIEVLSKRMSKSPNGDEAMRLQQLIRLFAARRGVLRRLRKDVQVQALLQIWLFIHVPMTIALLFALALHIFSVFYFW